MFGIGASFRKIRRSPAHYAKVAVGTAAIGLGVIGIALFFILRGVPDPTRISERTIAQSTRIYDRTGTVVLYDVHGEEKRTVIPFEKIPDSIKKATIAIEDNNFYSHKGIDPRGILRALYINLTTDEVQGGSTITQQLVTNSLLRRDFSLIRKVREAILAIIVEARLSKDEILGLYLNQIPYGANAYGIEAAAETYFGKSAENLGLAESAMLAALPKGPTYYSPYGSRRDKLMARKDLVLTRMAELGFISEEEAAQAKKEALAIRKVRQNILAPHFVMYIKEYLAEKYGETVVEQGGLKVITTLDWDLQQIAERVVREGAEKNESLIDARNSALVAMNPESGEIIAMAGSRDFFGDPSPKGCTPGVNCKFDPQVNIAIKLRQPGSAFKPFVYATALDKGYTDQTVLFDVPTEFNTRCNYDGSAPPGIDPKSCYSPGNYDEKFRGPVSLRKSLAQSLNVPSVELLYLAGVEDSIKTATRVGITSINYDPSRYGLALVLGGAEVTLLDMVHSYGAFARDGVQTEMAGIIKIEDSDGNTLEEKKERADQVLDAEVARMINDILSDNDARQPVFAPRSSLYFEGRQVAAKTGTTQDYRDAWTIGYTPSLVVGVWSGNNDNRPMQQKGSGVLASAPIFHAFMEEALKDTPPETFIKPAPAVAEKPILRGLWRGDKVIVLDKASGKLATDQTPEEYREEIAVGEPHTILHWVNRNDPRGPAPSDPSQDPQYQFWEFALQRWLRDNPLSPPPPIPAEVDTIHTEANKPQFSVISPSASDVIKSGELIKVRLRYRSTFSLARIDIFVDEQLKRSLQFPPNNNAAIDVPTNDLGSGELQLKIVLIDIYGNRSDTSLPLLLTP